jgi:pyruvate-ferredoxin/flavodoxin oxidoreductase
MYRYNPALAQEGKNPLVLDSRAPKMGVEEYFSMENRFKMLRQSKPEVYQRLMHESEADVKRRHELYQNMAAPRGA